MLTWAISVHDTTQGTLLVLAFSVGTVLSLLPFGFVAGGLLAALRRRFDGAVDTLAPTAAGSLMLVLGILLTFGLLPGVE